MAKDAEETAKQAAKDGNGIGETTAKDEAEKQLQWLADNIQSGLGEWTNETFLGMAAYHWIALVLLFAAGIALGYLIEWSLILLVRYRGGKEQDEWEKQLIDLLPKPGRLTVAFFALWLGSLASIDLSEEVQNAVTITIQTLLIISLTWLMLRCLTVAATAAEHYLAKDIEDPLQKRAAHTQVAIPAGILRWILILFGAALLFLQFEAVRTFGYGLLGSAGVSAIVLGFAARTLFENIFAGLQLALFQPIKIGDVLIVQGEWGTVEEVTLTYVVLRIWDQRALVVPVTYFTSNPIENWTKGATELLGTVYLHADYTVPVDEVRDELKRVLKEDKECKKLFDGRASSLIVTDVTAETVELRAMVSAKDSSDIWNLRCLVREKLLEWIKSGGWGHEPKKRVELIDRREEAGDGKSKK